MVRNWSTKSPETCRSGHKTTHGKYWEAADENERANGRLYSEVQFALPKELSEKERRELAGEFAERVCSRERLPYTLAIHRGGANGENPHAHLMFSERGHDGIERSAEQWFKRYNAEGPGEGGGEEIAGGQGRGLAGEDPRGVGADGEPGAGAGGPCRADRRPQPGRSAGRSAPGGRPEAGGGVEPGAERPSWPGAVQDDPGRGVGDGPTGRARRAEERSGPGRAGRRQQAGGAAGAGDRPDRSAAEGDL